MFNGVPTSLLKADIDGARYWNGVKPFDCAPGTSLKEIKFQGYDFHAQPNDEMAKM